MCLSREAKITNSKPGTERQGTYLHTQHYIATDRINSHRETAVIDREESRKLMNRLWANNITSHPQQRAARTPYLSTLLHCILGVEGQSRAAMGFGKRSAWATHWFAFNSKDTQTHTPANTVAKHMQKTTKIKQLKNMFVSTHTCNYVWAHTYGCCGLIMKPSQK